MSLHILIPCKALSDGKSRLAAVLAPAERHALCAQLLRRSLTLALALRPADRVWVITPDPAACAIARDVGARTFDDGGLRLNEALRRGLARAIGDRGDMATALILPIDLPYATADAVGRALLGDGDVSLAPDEARRGTNLLYIGSRALLAFCFAFGPDSFAAHQAWARREGFRVAVIDDPRLAFDLDRPEDYTRWSAASSAI